MIIAFKYNIKCMENPTRDDVWIIHKDADKGPNPNPIYTNYLAINAPCWTNNRLHDMGFCMMAEGRLVKKLNPLSGKPYYSIEEDK